MPQAENSLSDFARPDVAFANAHRGFACWTRAWTQIAQGVISAGVAQIELAKTLTTQNAGEWERADLRRSPRETANLFIENGKIRYDETMRVYRRINDDLTATLLSATESLLNGLDTDSPAMESGADAKADNARLKAKPVTDIKPITEVRHETKTAPEPRAPMKLPAED